MSARPAPSRRETFPYAIEIATRFLDNDVYGHVNNVVYGSYVDTVVNRYLIEHGLDIHRGEIIGLAVESGMRFFSPFSYPEPVEARLRVGHLGTSSVRYEIGLFGVDESELCRAEGHFVHVFVDRASRKPTPIPEALRQALSRLKVG